MISVMKTHIGKAIIVSVSAFLLCCTLSYAQDQQQEPPDYLQIAEEMADKWETILDLDNYQLFYIDSTLKHDYVAMDEELRDLQARKVSNSSLYYTVQDKWMEAIDNSFRKILDDRQWEIYLRNGALKLQKQREKRREKAEKADMSLKNR